MNDGGLLVAKKKTEFSEPVKLRPAFKKKLQRIAVAHGVGMGELIERQMKQFIDQETAELAAKELGLQPKELPPGPA